MRSPRRAGHQSGTVYLAVLSTTAIVTTIALTGLALVRVEGQIAAGAAEVAAARRGAVSAIEYARAAMKVNANWRTDAVNTGGIGSFTLNGAVHKITVTDRVDGNLSNWEDDPVEILAVSELGNAKQMFRATVRPRAEALTCLGAGIAAADDVIIDKGVVAGSGMLFSNRTIDARNARIRVRAEAVEVAKGLTYEAGSSGGKAARAFPGAGVAGPYIAVGTAISFASIPSKVIQKVMISPASNPFGGATNAKGVYVVDCGNNDITIQNCRISGTLVLTNVSTLTIAGSVSWATADPALPALICIGKANISMSRQPLSGTALDAGFASPELFESRIAGLVYISDDINIAGEPVIFGELIAGRKLDVVSDASLTVFFEDRYAINPPPGFRASTEMVIEPGSFARVVE